MMAGGEESGTRARNNRSSRFLAGGADRPPVRAGAAGLAAGLLPGALASAPDGGAVLTFPWTLPERKGVTLSRRAASLCHVV